MCLFSFFWAVDINTIQKWGNLRLVLFYAYSPHFPILFSIFFFGPAFHFCFTHHFPGAFVAPPRSFFLPLHCTVLHSLVSWLVLLLPPHWPSQCFDLSPRNDMRWGQLATYPVSLQETWARLVSVDTGLISCHSAVFFFTKINLFLSFLPSVKQNVCLCMATCHCGWSCQQCCCVSVSLPLCSVFFSLHTKKLLPVSHLCACREGGH